MVSFLLAIVTSLIAIILIGAVLTHWDAIVADPPHFRAGKGVSFVLGSPVLAVVFVVMHIRARKKLKARNERDGTSIGWWVI